MKKELRIVYMGTPEFAVPSLQILVEEGYNVVGVITAPDRPAGRGQQIKQSPVKEYAVSQGLKVLQPEKLKNEAFLEELRSLNANLQIVVAFRMLPEVVWNMPEIGTFNLHGSLLPQYRGAAPINWAVMNGEKETGVTTFFLKHEIDTGDLIMQEKETITEVDNVGTVYERLMHKGAKLVLKTVQSIEEGNYTTTPQIVGNDIKEAPKIFRETCEIDWNKTTEEIYNHIRGLSPYPASWTTLNGKNCKIFKTEKLEKDIIEPFETDNKTYLHIKTANGALNILELQLAGKKRMDIKQFLQGVKVESV